MSGVIFTLCERLADAYELQGVTVRANLRPGVSREVVLKALAPLGIAVPEEVIELYSWANGHILEEDWDHHRHVRFRDGVFLSVERIVGEYAGVQQFYGQDSTLADDRIDLRSIVPISSYEGAWNVVACGAHLSGTQFDHPVFHVHQGIDMYFHSVESMLRTCIDWVSSPHWEHLTTLPRDIEMEIWRRHNPGIFESKP